MQMHGMVAVARVDRRHGRVADAIGKPLGVRPDFVIDDYHLAKGRCDHACIQFVIKIRSWERRRVGRR
jgi:hypothetical protein